MSDNLVQPFLCNIWKSPFLIILKFSNFILKKQFAGNIFQLEPAINLPWAHVSYFRLLDTHKQTDRQANKVYIYTYILEIQGASRHSV